MNNRPKQSVAQELQEDLLRLIRQKFYTGSPDDPKAFAQDRRLLLRWVIFWPAAFINEKRFTITGERYKQIFSNVILEAVRHGNTSKLGYRPAWLRMVMQSHFRTHWEEYYDEAKSARAQADHFMNVLGKLKVIPDTDPVKDFSIAYALLVRSKPVKKPRQKQQENLEFKL